MTNTQTHLSEDLAPATEAIFDRIYATYDAENDIGARAAA